MSCLRAPRISSNSALSDSCKFLRAWISSHNSREDFSVYFSKKLRKKTLLREKIVKRKENKLPLRPR